MTTSRASDHHHILVALFACALSASSCYDGKPEHDPLRGPWQNGERLESERHGSKADDRPPRAVQIVAGTELSGDTPSLQGADSKTDPQSDETSPGSGEQGALHSRPPVAAPSGDVATSSCVNSACHENMSATTDVHSRATVESCEACHKRIGGTDDHTFRLVADEGGVCRSCHNREPTKKIIHGPFRESRCLACHDAHGGETKSLLLHQSGAELCGTCHENRIGPESHGPYARGECLSCHEPHESDFASLARKGSAELCLSCHDKEIESQGGTRKVANISAIISSSLFKHGPIRDGECSGCHNAHGTTNSNLLRKAYPKDFYQDYKESHYALCFQCHESTLVIEERTTTLTNFRDGDRNLHFLHVNQDKGRSCRACHEVHASNHPFHISETVPYGDSGWLLPINYSQTSTGGACTPGCHLTRTYDR